MQHPLQECSPMRCVWVAAFALSTYSKSCCMTASNQQSPTMQHGRLSVKGTTFCPLPIGRLGLRPHTKVVWAALRLL